MKNKPKLVTVGSVWESNRYGNFEVVRYINAMNVIIKFNKTGFTVKVQASQVRNGNIKDLMLPSVCGVGYIGGTKYKSKGSRFEVDTYTAWVNMINRCYNEKLSSKYPAYKDCTVCHEWHNFQNFAEWVISKGIKSLNGFYLDKDLKIPGNKTYSPKACMFVSRDVNNFTTDRSMLRGEYLIGVTTGRGFKGYMARCWNTKTGEREYLGLFSSEIEAHLAWRKAKSDSAKHLADMQKSGEARDAILTWKRALDSEQIHLYR